MDWFTILDSVSGSGLRVPPAKIKSSLFIVLIMKDLWLPNVVSDISSYEEGGRPGGGFGGHCDALP